MGIVAIMMMQGSMWTPNCQPEKTSIPIRRFDPGIFLIKLEPGVRSADHRQATSLGADPAGKSCAYY